MIRAGALLVLFLGPLACEKRFYTPTSPSGPATPTPTLTSLPSSTPTFSPTSTSTTLAPTATATSICQPVPTTNVTVGLVNQEMAGNTTLFQSLAQWQSAGGLPASPVDFSTQMIILIVPSSCNNPVSSVSVTGVCENSDEIIISGYKSPYCGPVCSYYMPNEPTMAYGIALPQSNLPVVWNITNLACDQITPLPLTYLTVTPTS